MLHRLTTLAALAMSLIGPATTIAAEPMTAGETPLITGLSTFKPSGALADSMGRFGPVAVAGQSFDKAMQAVTTGSPANRWDVMLQAPLGSAISQGDTLLVRFWVRTTDAMADDGMIGVAVELNREPWTKLAEGQYNAPRQWTLIQLPFAAKQAFDAGTVNVNLRLGYPSQTLEIGGLELVRLPAGVQLDSLAHTSIGYRGMEPDAPWRVEALKRIDRIRKADLQVVVHDQQGNPVANCPVHFTLTRNAFHFGSAVDAKLVLADSASGAQYRGHIESSFNTVVYENDLKWLSLDANPNRYNLVDQTLPWFSARNIDVRGHCLVWPSLKWLPPSVAALKNDPSALGQAVDDHITSLVGRYRGKLTEWDVLNEPYTNRDLEKILGRDAYVDWFKLAHAADPSAKLFINDFGILETGNRLETDHQKFYELLIQELLAKGAPIDGIGIQGHFGSAVTDPENLLAILDRFGRFGKPIRITELDVNMLDPEQRANFLRDVYIACFSHPSVDGVIQWGFWEGRHWLPEAAVYSRDWNLRPHGQTWKTLMDEWTTDVTPITGADGTATIRGFLGDYTLQAGDITSQAKLTSAGGRVVLTVK